MPNTRPKRRSRTTSSRARPASKAHEPRWTARNADPRLLYEKAVQEPEAEIDFVDAQFLRIRGKRATLIREDFCGSAAVCVEWVNRRKGNRAIGVDLDRGVLAWAREHNLPKAGDRAANITLVEGNVLDDHHRGTNSLPRPEAVLAMNFSYWIFSSRNTLREYFRRVHGSLAPGGLFFLDHYGGYESGKEFQERRRCSAGRGKPYTYIWDQQFHNPLTGEYRCAIHFELPDKTKIRNAFSYHWRLWTLPETRELLAEAGFRNVTVFCEGDDGDGGGNGVFKPATKCDADATFLAYIVAEP
jgi:SAM-dependent methyltransferase